MSKERIEEGRVRMPCGQNLRTMYRRTEGK